MMPESAKEEAERRREIPSSAVRRPVRPGFALLDDAAIHVDLPALTQSPVVVFWKFGGGPAEVRPASVTL